MIPELEMILRVLAATVLGALVGLERERQHQPAGLRTHMVLVAGSALAMTLSINLAAGFHGIAPNGDPARLAAQVLAGIGFLCAGAILRFGTTVKGLTTAASLWTMAVVGLAVGAGYYLVSAAITLLLLGVLTLVTFFEDRFVKRFQTLQFTILAVDRIGIEKQVRAAFAAGGNQLESFRTNHHVHQQRIRLEALVRLRPAQTGDSLCEQISQIKGVRVVKYE